MDANVNNEWKQERRVRSWMGGALSLIAGFGLVACTGGDPQTGTAGSTETSDAPAQAAEPTSEPSVLFVTFDTTRADIIGCYGGPPGATITLDTLADEGLLYENAHTSVPVTTPAHASMFTGLYPIRHGVRGNDVWMLPDEVPSLPELAQRDGIQTAAFVAAVVLHDRFGLGRGFDTYQQPEVSPGASAGGHAYTELKANQVVDQALAWYEARDVSRPFFMWVHLFDPHIPYEPPPEFRSDFYGGNPYLGEVGFADRETGRLIERMRDDGVLDRTLVMVLGDHGESLGAHGEMSHGVLCHEPTLRVPLIVRYPDGYRAGERSDELVSVIDVLPTLADALGVATPDDIDGTSLYKKTVAADRGLYFESYEGWMGFGYSPLAGWIDARGKYLHSSTPLFYDLAGDPQEISNLVEEKTELVREFKSRIGEVASRERYEPTTSTGDTQETLNLLNELSKIGYGGTGGDTSLTFPEPLAPSELPSATDAIEIHRHLVVGLARYHGGEYPEAEEILASVVEALPQNPAALLYLGYSRINQMRHADAIDPLERLTNERPTLAFGHFNLGVCYGATDDLENAKKHLEIALQLDPNAKEYYPYIITVLRKMNLIEEALGYDAEYRILDTAGK